jgi:hypothetical protein
MSFVARAYVLFVCVSTGTIAAAGVVLRGAPELLYIELFAIEFGFAVLLGVFAMTTPPSDGPARAEKGRR